MTTELITRARAGDGDAFQTLTEPYRRELLVHCYRMLGSFQDAEDALQDTLLSAWQGIERFEGRASIRTWLYRIATNRCLDALRSAKRRPAKEWNISEIQLPEPSRLGEIVWLEPFPDALLEGAADTQPGPEARYEQTEAISLAYVTALQVLPARQRAVLVLREVLGYHADEVADMLGATVDSVNSALKRARSTLQRRLPPRGEDTPPPAPDSPAERELVAKFVRAYESGDVNELVAMLTADVSVSMPPIPLEYHGRDVVARFYASIFGRGPRYDLMPTRANGQLAFGAYLRTPVGGIRHGAGLLVLTVSGDRICALTRFDNDVLPSFGLPRSLPG
ncbi:sigma-70 family RNA polymerase sigma factor [Mycobacterium sp. NPDC050551]|uniref:sigma-70 family RNA polymerase sigma factor n=1 Tax=Mycobacterium sp. NPDC050551 TaxID=3155407 RepID=UPI0034458936